jgi:hypothetical protein
MYRTTAVLTTRGHVYICGYNTGSALGKDPTSHNNTLTLIKTTVDNPILTMYPGGFHMILQTHDDRLFAFGDSGDHRCIIPAEKTLDIQQIDYAAEVQRIFNVNIKEMLQNKRLKVCCAGYRTVLYIVEKKKDVTLVRKKMLSNTKHCDVIVITKY